MLFTYFQQTSFIYGIILHEKILNWIKEVYQLSPTEYRLILAVNHLSMACSQVNNGLLKTSLLFPENFNFSKYLPDLIRNGFLQHPYKSAKKSYVLTWKSKKMLDALENDFPKTVGIR